MNNSKDAPQELVRLIKTVKTLRGPGGCPWDRQQTVESLKKHLREECEEILEAIEKKDPANLCEELGDVLYLIVMMSEISEEQQTFSFSDVAKRIHEKLIRRHPHVFSDVIVEDEKELRQQWNRIKAEEKLNKR